MFRFNEDCNFTCCNYREHQTHFHCMRKDCNYRFCDKTRFVQHTARHERLDTLCGSEFEGFRGVTCGRDSCEFNINNLKGEMTTRLFNQLNLVHTLECTQTYAYSYIFAHTNKLRLTQTHLHALTSTQTRPNMHSQTLKLIHTLHTPLNTEQAHSISYQQ